MRRSALPSVWPKPRSSGSATSVAKRVWAVPGVTWSLFGRISSCQFFWIVTVFTRGPVDLGQLICPLITGVGDLADHSAACNSSQKPLAGDNAARSLKTSNPPAFARTATIVRDRRHVADRRHGE